MPLPSKYPPNSNLPAGPQGNTGARGETGPAGPQGPEGPVGRNAYALTVETFLMPGTGSEAFVLVDDATPLAVGDNVRIETAGAFKINSKVGNVLTVEVLNSSDNAPEDTVIAVESSVTLSGEVGATGPAGADGVDGADGADGAQGPAGTDGLDGTDGADGKTWHNGSGAPSDGTGVDGDFYLDTTNDAYYGPKAAGTWTGTGPTSLIGPTGPEGPSGEAGTVAGYTAVWQGGTVNLESGYIGRLLIPPTVSSSVEITLVFDSFETGQFVDIFKQDAANTITIKPGSVVLNGETTSPAGDIVISNQWSGYRIVCVGDNDYMAFPFQP